MKCPRCGEIDKGYCVYTDYVYLGKDDYASLNMVKKKTLKL